jgi:hypothetical protein
MTSLRSSSGRLPSGVHACYRRAGNEPVPTVVRQPVYVLYADLEKESRNSKVWMVFVQKSRSIYQFIQQMLLFAVHLLATWAMQWIRLPDSASVLTDVKLKQTYPANRHTPSIYLATTAIASLLVSYSRLMPNEWQDFTEVVTSCDQQ